MRYREFWRNTSELKTTGCRSGRNTVKTIADLERIRENTRKNMMLQNKGQEMRVVIGMATCGLAAGAKPVLQAMQDECRKRNVSLPIIITGCIGVCRLEPLVEVYHADGTRVTYVKMTPEKAVKVVNSHFINQTVCKEYTIDSEE